MSTNQMKGRAIKETEQALSPASRINSVTKVEERQQSALLSFIPISSHFHVLLLSSVTFDITLKFFSFIALFLISHVSHYYQFKHHSFSMNAMSSAC